MANVLTNRMYDNRVRKMIEIEALINGLKDQLDEVKGEIVSSMDMSGVDEVRTDNFVIRNKVIVTSRFDSKAFKKDHEDIYNDYVKASASVRFTHNKV